MTLPSGGSLSMSAFNVEIQRSSTSQLSMSDGTLRSIAGIGSGQISFSNLYGKSYIIPYISPSNVNDSGNGGLHDFTITAGTNSVTPSSWSWSVSSTGGTGNWTINSGQGTGTAGVRVAATAPQDTAYATVNVTMVVAGNTYNLSATLSWQRNS